MKRMIFALIALMLVTAVTTDVYAEIGFSGDATMVSTYVWRGVKQFNGAAMQGTAEFSYGALSVGYWISNMHGPVEVETDPYIGVALPTGDIETSIGATLYSYDFFEKSDYTVYEIYGSAGYGPVGVGFFFTPSQDNMDDSVYWLEVGAGTAYKGADLGATLGYGTYSSPNDDAAVTLLLSAGTAVSEALSVGWNWSVGLSEDMENIFFMSASYGF